MPFSKKNLIWRSTHSRGHKTFPDLTVFNNSQFFFEHASNTYMASNNSSAMFDAFSARRYNFQSRVDLAPLRAWFFRVLT